MGLFDSVKACREEFKCSEGHDLAYADFQTKDLGCGMGTWTIGSILTQDYDGGYGDAPKLPFLGRISVYASCTECPAFVQSNTGNLCQCYVEFEVEIVDDVVRKITRVSPDTSVWLETEPKQPWMVGCLGPMTKEEAQVLSDKIRTGARVNDLRTK